MRTKLLITAITALLGLVVAPIASAQRDTGINKLKAAGIYVAPRAVPILESAPLGSCPNDLLQAGCGPPPKAVLMAPSTMIRNYTATTSGTRVPAIGTSNTFKGAYCERWTAPPDRPPGERYIHAWGQDQCGSLVKEGWMWVVARQWMDCCNDWSPRAWSTVGHLWGGGKSVARTASKRCKWYGGSWWKNGRAWQSENDLNIRYLGKIWVFEPDRINDGARCVS